MKTNSSPSQGHHTSSSITVGEGFVEFSNCCHLSCHVRRKHYLNYLPVIKGVQALSSFSSIHLLWARCTYKGTNAPQLLNWELALFLVYDETSYLMRYGNKPSTEKLTCQEMMTGGLGQNFDSNKWGRRSASYLCLKQLQAFDVLAREKIVLAPVTVKAMSYSWAGIRSGIAEKQAPHQIFEWLIATYVYLNGTWAMLNASVWGQNSTVTFVYPYLGSFVYVRHARNGGHQGQQGRRTLKIDP